MVLLHQDAIKAEMRRICAQFPKDELFFAARMWSPVHIAASGLSFGEDTAHVLGPRYDTLFAMALRRVTVGAALLYGGPVPEDRVTIVGGSVPPQRLGLFVACFAALMALARAYLFQGTGPRIFCGAGYEIDVNENGIRYLDEDEEEQDVLTFSCDNRRHRYFDLLSRVGEFSEVPLSILEPYEDRGKQDLGGRAALYSAWYEPDSRGTPGYRTFAKPLDHVEALMLGLDKLDPNPAKEAWGMGFKEFVALLGGFSDMVGDRLGADWFVEAARLDVTSMSHGTFRSATLPFFEPELEGDGEGTLIAYAVDYAKKKGLDPNELDLRNARRRFLDLAVSNGKGETADESPDPCGISIGDGRYAHLLHKFGKTYVADLFHADHWINRPLDLLAGKMRAGESGKLKGKRVEDAVWDYMRRSEKIEPVEELRNANLRLLPGAKKRSTDIDCPLLVGDTIVLVEVKGKYMGRAVEAFADPRLVQKRWEENRELLEKVDDGARALVERKNDATFRKGMEGVRRVLPVVVRPLPEWVPSLDDDLWLRKPTRTDVGLPRVLTPEELREFLEGATDGGMPDLPGGYVVEEGHDGSSSAAQLGVSDGT